MLKLQAARMATLEKQMAEERECRLEAEYLAQAEEEMYHLPGDIIVKARCLRAIDENIEDEDVREALGKMLAPHIPTFNVPLPRGMHPFEKRVSAIKNRDGIKRHEALRKARDEHPDEFEDWQSYGEWE
jgi:hypothetical protein